MSTVLVVASAVWAAAKRWMEVMQHFLGLGIADGRQFLFLLENKSTLLVGQLLVEPLQQPSPGLVRAQAADLMERLPLDVEQVVELGLPAVGVLELFGQLALVVLDHLLLFLQLLGPLLHEVLLLIEMPLALEQLLTCVVELILDPCFFAKCHLLGFDFGLLSTGACRDFGFFQDLLRLLLRIPFTQIAQQLHNAHTHECGHDGHGDDKPGVGPFSGRRLGENKWQECL